jgi:hypothetical protein
LPLRRNLIRLSSYDQGLTLMFRSVALTSSVSNLLSDFKASGPATFASTRVGDEPGRSFNRITAALPVLPNHPLPKLISSAGAGPILLLSDTPATLCPEEYGINNV